MVATAASNTGSIVGKPSAARSVFPDTETRIRRGQLLLRSVQNKRTELPLDGASHCSLQATSSIAPMPPGSFFAAASIAARRAATSLEDVAESGETRSVPETSPPSPQIMFDAATSRQGSPAKVWPSCVPSSAAGLLTVATIANAPIAAETRNERIRKEWDRSMTTTCPTAAMRG